MTRPQAVPPLPSDIGIVLVDHGSVKHEANRMLEDVARLYAQTTQTAIVEPAHMELAEPTIEQALAKCVARGARTVFVMPYFLFPGRHSAEDIPRMAHAAAAKHPATKVVVTEPLGLDARLTEIVHQRIRAKLENEA